MNLEECFEKNLLKRDRPDREKAMRSIAVAKDKLQSAKTLFDLKQFDMALVNIYSSMFHASRALLFRDGIKEKSHYGLYVYIKEEYRDKIPLKFINELNVMRAERHEIFYGLEKTEIKEIEVESLMYIAEAYIKLIEKLV